MPARRTQGRRKVQPRRMPHTQQEQLERLAGLVLHEIDRILFDLEFRRDMLFKLWSKNRTRAPLLQTLRSHYYALSFDQLRLFPAPLARQLDTFYRLLDAFIFYVSYTEDMPQSLQQKFSSFLQELKGRATPVMDALRDLAGEDELAALEIPDFGD